MKAKAEIDARICGFRTTGQGACEDDQHVGFTVETDCEKIRELGARLQALGPLDAFEEIHPASGSRLLATVRKALPGCCAGCAMPVGLFKAMQVAAGLILPTNTRITLRRE